MTPWTAEESPWTVLLYGTTLSHLYKTISWGQTEGDFKDMVLALLTDYILIYLKYLPADLQFKNSVYLEALYILMYMQRKRKK